MFIRRKSSTSEQTHGRDRQSHALMIVGIPGAFLPGLLWPILLLLVMNQYLVFLRILPLVHVHLLPKMDSSKEAYE